MAFVDGEAVRAVFADDSVGQSYDTSSVQILGTDLERTATPIREADAETASKFVIDNNFIDPDNGCEFCTKIAYTPGKEMEAGVAYKDAKINLEDSQRLVFFVKSQGVNQASFLAAGNDPVGINNKNNDTDIFPRIDFDIVTKNVTLNNDWQRFEISLNDTQINDTTYPFGIQLNAQDASNQQVLYLKGVTLDSKPALDPLPIINQTTPGNITSLVAIIETNATANQSSPATVEFKANATGGTDPYSFSWKFGDGNGVNGTSVGKITSHTFTHAGVYNVSLIATDSATPSQNASANALLTIMSPANTTAAKNATTHSTDKINTNVTNSIGVSSNSTTDSINFNTNATREIGLDSEVFQNVTRVVPLTMLTGNATNSTDIELEMTSEKVGDNKTGLENNNNNSHHDSTLKGRIINQIPKAYDQQLKIEAKNRPYDIMLAGSDAENDPIRFEITSHPVHGDLSAITIVNATSSKVIYIPKNMYENHDSFTIKANDGTAESATAKVSIDFVRANHAPVAEDGRFISNGNEALYFQLKGSDPDNDDTVKFEIVSKPHEGAITGFDEKTGLVSYIATSQSSGADRFTFKVIDNHNEESHLATVSINLKANADGALTVSGSNAVTFIGRPIEIRLEVDGSDVNDTEFVITSKPIHGKLRGLVNIDQTTAKVMYFPDTDYLGNDLFEFKARGVTGEGSSNSAKVFITIVPPPPGPNSSPVAESQSINTDQNKKAHITLGGTDADGEKIIFSLIDAPSHGKIISFDSVGGILMYKPQAMFSGEDSFTFKVSDTNGAKSNVAKVLIKVHLPDSSSKEVEGIRSEGEIGIQSEKTMTLSENSNHHPSADAGPDRTIYEGTKQVILSGTGSDPDGDPVSYFWKQITGPRIELKGVNTNTVIFNTPYLDGDVVIKLILRVIDDKMSQDVDEVNINVKDIAELQETRSTGNLTR